MGKTKRHIINFSKYFLVGVITSLLNVLFSWILIDIIGIRAIISSSVVGSSLFLTKYFSYRKVKLIHKKFKIFMIISLSSIFLYISLSFLLIDILNFKTLIVIPAIIIFLFLLRFFAFHWTKIIKEG